MSERASGTPGPAAAAPRADDRESQAPGAGPAEAQAVGRRLQCYGRRSARSLRIGRRALVSERLPRLAIALPEDGGPLHPSSLFDDPVSAVWLEVGFGAGEHLIGQALSHPDVGLIGCEPYVAGVASLIRQIEATGVGRIRVYPDDARALLFRLASASLDRVFVLFPDPWPKRRHHRRRFVQRETVDTLARVLKPGGELLFATDHGEYACWALAILTAHPAFRWCARRPDDWRRPPAGAVPTRYETKARARGAACIYLRYRRIGPA